MFVTAEKSDTPVRCVGFDSGGEVFLSEGRVLRGIYPGCGPLYRQVLRTCETYDLFQYGIVATRELPDQPYPDLRYDLVLEHERIPFVTYPHEWSASMLKDAALLHIDLFIRLGRHGLVFKDWHPYNILFKGTNPVFVDFGSIIPTDQLLNEAYLTPPRVTPPFGLLWQKSSAYFHEMYWRMFVPYFLLPLYWMNDGKHALARTRLFETTMNTSNSVITSEEVFSGAAARWRKYRMMDLAKKFSLTQRSQTKTLFLWLLNKEVQALNISNGQSDYVDYYASKNEDFEFEPSPNWTKKQIVVFEAIKDSQPTTLLDVGSNTGWFSILAAKMGCQVVALDIDEACIDRLYHRARRDALSILPLVMDLADSTPDVPALEFENEPSRSLIGGDSPLLLSADKRLKCDMVLALAIIHHLALGRGLHLNEIAQTLSKYASKCLVVEFVAIDDPLVAGEPTFFPALHANPHDFGWYTLENLKQELGRYFPQIEVKESHPESRVILICKK